MWKPASRGMKPFRGMRVRCRYTSHTKIHRDHKNRWYTGRIIGNGNVLGTFEVLFDPEQGANDEEDDRHLRTPLWSVKPNRSPGNDSMSACTPTRESHCGGLMRARSYS